MPDALLSIAALLASIAGMGWLALAMDVHWRQVHARPLSPAASRRLRSAGVTALVASLAAGLAVDHASMAVLVWIMNLAVSALLVALALAWWPRALRPLVPAFAAFPG